METSVERPSVFESPYPDQFMFKSVRTKKKWHQKYYRKYKKYYLERQRRRRREFRNVVKKYKDVPCADCHQRFPYYCMDFDHVRGKKKFEISDVNVFSSLKRLLEEIAKCDVVCSNCHRIRTYGS